MWFGKRCKDVKYKYQTFLPTTTTTVGLSTKALRGPPRTIAGLDGEREYPVHNKTFKPGYTETFVKC